MNRVMHWMLLVAVGAMAYVFLVSYEGRVQIVKGQRLGCARGIDDRLSSIVVRTVQAQSAQAIADDPFQSKLTRTARAREARVLRVSVRDLRERVDPAHGGKLVCTVVFPDATLLP